MLRTDIGENDAALLCTTDSDGCCNGTGIDGDSIVGRAGEFYFPNGTQVPISNDDLNRTYYRNRINGAIRLNRRHSGTITGRFHCEIPDVTGTKVNLFINIGK